MYKIKTKLELEELFCHEWDRINAWIDHMQEGVPQLLTSSIDIRESRDKFAPVDHNTYPAGFNNICQKDLLRGSDLFKSAISKIAPGAQNVAIIPESHTKNRFYLDHLHALKETIRSSGMNVVIVSPDPEFFAEVGVKHTLESHSGHTLEIHFIEFQNGLIKSKDPALDLKVDFILLNHDQSTPLPVDWRSVKTPVHPSPFMGWYQRQKIKHFQHYHEVIEKFCREFSIDPYLMEARFTSLQDLNFNTKEGMDELAGKVDQFFTTLPANSQVFIKASQGTYGMGISVVSSGEEVRTMNRKMRNKMDVGKNNLKFTSVLIQEGVETIIKYEDAPAEVTIYLINGKSCGGFIRANPLKGTQANLNSQGMVYRKLCISDIKQDNDYQIKECVYCVIARLSALAAAHEAQEMMKEK